jgi:hypothetical protein
MVVAPGLEWLRDPSKRGILRHRLEDCRYVITRNPDAKDGLWKIKGRRQTVYARADLTVGQRMSAAANKLL